MAWFFGTFLESAWTFIPKNIWGLPWYRTRTNLNATWKENSCLSYQWSGQSRGGTEELDVVGTGEPQGILDGFSDEDHCWSILTHPFDGYLYLRNKHVGHYSVWHHPLSMERAQINSARFTFWENLGLIKEKQEPHSVLVQEKIHYLIQLPPKRVKDL